MSQLIKLCQCWKCCGRLIFIKFSSAFKLFKMQSNGAISTFLSGHFYWKGSMQLWFDRFEGWFITSFLYDRNFVRVVFAHNDLYIIQRKNLWINLVNRNIVTSKVVSSIRSKSLLAGWAVYIFKLTRLVYSFIAS